MLHFSPERWCRPERKHSTRLQEVIMPSESIIPFVILPVSLIHDRRVTERAIRVYGCLLTYKNRRTSRCDPHRDTIAKKLRCSVRSVSRCLTELRQAGWISSKQTLNG